MPVTTSSDITLGSDCTSERSDEALGRGTYHDELKIGAGNLLCPNFQKIRSKAFPSRFSPCDSRWVRPLSDRDVAEARMLDRWMISGHSSKNKTRTELSRLKMPRHTMAVWNCFRGSVVTSCSSPFSTKLRKFQTTQSHFCIYTSSEQSIISAKR